MITFTTDYGLSDGFVAACHGVIAGFAPDVRVLDITHDVPPGDVRRGATVLAQTVPYLPVAVHLAVVDPGVGTSRRGLCVVARRGDTFVGPDNGLLVDAAQALGGVRAAYSLTERRFWLPEVSRTFHGRDVFAPVAARLALGLDPSALGPPVSDLVTLPPPFVHVQPGLISADILTIDRFGNLQLAATATDLATAGFAPGDAITITLHDHPPTSPRAARDVPKTPFVPVDPTDLTVPPPRPRTVPQNPFVPDPPDAQPPVPATVVHTFADAQPGTLVVLIDSAGHIAIATPNASAATHLSAHPHTRATLRRGSS